MHRPQLFLDCDGVLADFDGYVESVLGMPPQRAKEHLGAAAFWTRLRAHGSVYRDLPVLPQGRALFEAVRHLSPIILTGLPEGDWAAPQKVDWAAEHFPGTPVITCMARDKCMHMVHPGDILVDDLLRYRHLWEEAGGIFVTYRNTPQTLSDLHALGLDVEIPQPR